jgi:hypothetical protein
VYEQVIEALQLPGTTDETRNAGGQLTRNCPLAHGFEGRGRLVRENSEITGQDPLVQLLQLGAGVGAQLVGQLPADAVVDGEGLGLAAAAVEDGDVLAGDPLVQRVCSDERGEVGEQPRMPALSQPGIEEVEPHREPLHFQGVPHAGGPRAVEVSQSLAAPQPQRLLEQVPCGSATGACSFRKPAEPVQIHCRLVDLDDVPARSASDPTVAGRGQSTSQPGHVATQRARRP